MESTKDIYKTGALLSAKRVLEQEREKYIRKQIEAKYDEEDERIVEQLTKKEVAKSRTDAPLIDVANTNKIKTLDEFINEAIEKDRQEVIKIGESLKELIENAPEEDVVELETENQSIEEFANASIQEDEEKDDFEKILESVEEQEITQESKEQEFIKPKYFIIEIGDEENSKQIVVDIEGQPVGKIENGKFEINEEYVNSKLEKYNIDDYISAKIPSIEEQQRIKQELKPKTLEQLAEIDFESGKEVIEKVDKIIEEPEKEIEPKDEEKDEIDDKTLEEDEEYEKDTVDELDEILKENDEKKVEDYLDKNSSRKLEILIPYTMTDQLRNHGLKERGEKIIVYQLKGGIEEPEFILKQGNRVLKGSSGPGYNTQIQNSLENIPYSSGVVREVSDEKTSAQVILADGTEKEFLVKGEPHDIDFNDKNAVIAKLSELSAELKRIMEITPDDMADYQIEFGNNGDKPEIKCQRIDEIEMEMYKICSQYGIVPPVEVKAQALDEKEPEELPENEGEEVEGDGWERTRYDGEPTDPRKLY